MSSLKTGPGYASPLEAMKAPREELLYVICVQPNLNSNKTDFLATVDVDSKSPTYCKVIHRLHTGNSNDELHHFGWNACSSCYKVKDCCKMPKRNRIVMPALGSKRIYIVDTEKNPRAPQIAKVIDSSEMDKFDSSFPHTTHCLPTGEIMISVMGDNKENGKGDFVLIDGESLKIKGCWTKGDKAQFGYDFWYQPYHDVLVSSEWGAPKVFKKGFHPDDILDTETYGRSLNFYSWETRKLVQTINLGDDGISPLEIRFLHNPKESQGYVGCAINANVFRFYKKDDGTWDAHKVIDVKPKKVSGWVTEYMQGGITDIVLSLDDKYIYFTNWFHGDVRQYDITDRENPKLTGQIYLGGMLLSDSKIKVLDDPSFKTPPDPVFVKGKRLYGSPQMLQLSLDGKRLYVSSSLYSPWDKQFYPESVKHGGFLIKLDIDTKKGGMALDPNFLIDFFEGEDGPVLPHEMRYPGGDCTSDIWLVDE